MRHRDHQTPATFAGTSLPWWALIGWLILPISLLLQSSPAGAGRSAAPLSGPTPAVQRRLAEALPLAKARLETYPACRQLFTDLGHDGLSRLESTRYVSTTLTQEQRICGSHSTAFTGVGHSVTWLCRSFSRLQKNQAAVVLLHEALHFSGMSEYPLDPEALHPAGINRLVQKSCKL